MCEIAFDAWSYLLRKPRRTMIHLPTELEHSEPSPELVEIIKASHARFQATGQMNPPVGSAESKPENRARWRAFWGRQFDKAKADQARIAATSRSVKSEHRSWWRRFWASQLSDKNGS